MIIPSSDILKFHKSIPKLECVYTLLDLKGEYFFYPLCAMLSHGDTQMCACNIDPEGVKMG